MKWLANLENNNIPFCIHILQKNDCLIMPTIIQKSNLIYVIDGFMQILKIFTNGENICMNLLYKNHIIPNITINIKENTNYYYKIVAITKTVIATIPSKILNERIQKNSNCVKEFQLLYNKNNNDITNILIYKNTKKRVIQLLLTISKHFGKIKPKYIIIPFYLSHNTIATITGSQRITINRIMYRLKKNNIINYDKHKILIYSIVRLIQF